MALMRASAADYLLEDRLGRLEAVRHAHCGPREITRGAQPVSRFVSLNTDLELGLPPEPRN